MSNRAMPGWFQFISGTLTMGEQARWGMEKVTSTLTMFLILLRNNSTFQMLSKDAATTDRQKTVMNDL
ncbi:Uncharacterised protein [Mycobacteroides abscessus subsp. abscessus]|nr:Uncharacterised protein [Mycobacteroides abscessus subsp. abscessus]